MLWARDNDWEMEERGSSHLLISGKIREYARVYVQEFLFSSNVARLVYNLNTFKNRPDDATQTLKDLHHDIAGRK